MRKFYDIKTTRQRAGFKNGDKSDLLDTKENSKEFWSESIFRNRKLKKKIKEEKKFRNKPIRSSFLSGFTVFAVLLFSMAFFYVKGVDAKDEVEKRAQSAKINIDLAINELEQGNISEAADKILLAKGDLKVIKINAQSWGQDIRYFGLIAPKESKAIELEKALNVCDKILSNITDLNSLLTANTSQIESLAEIDENGKIVVDVLKLSDSILPGIKNAKEKVDESQKLLAEINVDELIGKDGYKKLIKNVNSLSDTLSHASLILHKDIPWITAKDGERNILVLFQNNTEIRPTGGFLGSFGVMNLKNGKISGIDFEKNIYKMDKTFFVDNQIEPPGELISTTQNWSMINSNWWLDSPDAFSETIRFYELESGQTVDGVIALDTTLFLDLLKQVGPIEMPEYGMTITEENFLEKVQYEVEVAYFQREGNKEENEPKKILAEMMPKFLNQLFQNLSDQAKAYEVIKILSKNLDQKHLLFYMKNEEFQKRLKQLNYAGSLAKAEDGYLYVSSTNIGGLKSSLNVEETINLNSTIIQDNIIENELTIERSHVGSYQWPDGMNKNYMRILVPKNSQVTNFEMISGNFERLFDKGFPHGNAYWIDEESGYVRINFWQNTKPGEKSEVKISYKYNLQSSEEYEMFFQKQPGLEKSKVNFSIDMPYSKKIFRKSFNLDKDLSFKYKIK